MRMIDRTVSDRLGRLCSRFISTGCIMSRCPLARYHCYGFRSPNAMYEQSAPNVKQKIDKILDEYESEAIDINDNKA